MPEPRVNSEVRVGWRAPVLGHGHPQPPLPTALSFSASGPVVGYSSGHREHLLKEHPSGTHTHYFGDCWKSEGNLHKHHESTRSRSQIPMNMVL